MKVSEKHWSQYKVCLNISARVYLLPNALLSLIRLNSPVQLELNKGNNVLFWRTTGFLLGGAVKAVLLRNITVSGRWRSILQSLLMSC